MKQSSVIIRYLWALPLILLAGCFQSAIPLVAETGADFPFQPFTYEVAGEDDRVTPVKMGNSYSAPNEQGEATLLLKKVAAMALNFTIYLRAYLLDSIAPG
jgi:hypothetical protein